MTIRNSNRFAATAMNKLAVAALMMAGLLSSSFAASPLNAQTAADSASAPAKTGKPSHYRRNALPQRAESYYGVVWGLDTLSVKAVESGALIRFSYRILDPQKAKLLNDKKTEAFLEAPARKVKLSIPSLEKVGQLRQGTTEESGKSYWMAFSNPRRTVKPGDHVNIVVGTFHANGLIVE